MLGKFQTSQLRIEVNASSQLIRDYLIHPRKLREWFWFAGFSAGLPETFTPGLNFTTNLGLIKVGYEVETVGNNSLRFLLYQGIDGYHEWLWGDGWLQSCVEGVSLLPLNLGQTLTLLSFREFLDAKTHSEKRSHL